MIPAGTSREMCRTTTAGPLRAVLRAVLISGVVILAGCASGADSATGTTGESAPDAGDGATTAPDDGSGDGDEAGDDVEGFESEQCDLFTADEITAVIGPHDGGQQDFLFGGCVWRATAADADGFTPGIHATVTEPDFYEALAEIGDPVDGFGAGATYAGLYGELWFPCADGMYCGIKGDIADGDERQTVTLALGALLRDRN